MRGNGGKGAGGKEWVRGEPASVGAGNRLPASAIYAL
jgi:hypothetical protein